jgi:acyl transferase domain-containing protein
MTENPAHQAPAEPIAVVGMACRFPDATGPAEFLELVLTGRRAFRRLPPARLDVSEYGEGEPGFPGSSGLAPGAFGSARAALLEGWRFDRAAYGVTLAAYQAADPAHWLALETAARALADGGFPGGQGLARDRTGVIIGNTLTGEVSRATALRTRWPYVRRVLRAALVAGEVSPERHAEVIEHAAAGFLAPFPEISDDTLAGSLPGAIADRICGHFGFRGGGHAVDAAHSSSLLAVAAACSALAAGDLDAAIAGGVDISLDPFELAGLAGTGVLASGDMRVFDARPTGFLPGEGCGLTVLMRAAEARSAGVPVYAEIAGWGVSSAGNPALTKPGSASLLLALRRAYHRARVDPSDVQLIEGDGTGTASGDLAELTSLAEIRQASPRLAALGSVKANIGHTKAAAGAAGLIKATLAIAAGIIPPATGCARPHPLIASEDARLRAPGTAEPWPERIRLAGVTSVGPGGASVHLILRRTRDGRRRRAPGLPQLQPGTGSPASTAGAGTGAGAGGRAPGADLSRSVTPARGNPAPPPAAVLAHTPRVEAFAVSGTDRQALARELARIAEVAPWLSDGELHDLACQYGRATAVPGYVRAGLVSGSQDQLAQAAGEALALLAGLDQGKLITAPGIVMADRGRGRVALLFPGEGSPPPGTAHPGSGTGVSAHDPAVHQAVVGASLSALEWLHGLGVTAVAAAGYGLGEITGLVWAGCLTEAEAARLVTQRAALLAVPSAEQTALVCVDAGRSESEALCADSGLVIAAYNGPRCHVLAGPAAAVHDLAQRLAEDGVPARLLDSPVALYSPAMADRVAPMRNVVRGFSFRPPARRLISTVTGTGVTAGDDIAAMLCAQLTSPVLFARALERAAAEADLLIETGPGRRLSCLAADCSDLPAFSLAAGRPDERATAHAAAALFGSGAVPTLAPLFAGRLARPIDIWRERVFIPSPCGAPAAEGDSTGAGRQATDGDMTGRGGPATHGDTASGSSASSGTRSGTAGGGPAPRGTLPAHGTPAPEGTQAEPSGSPADGDSMAAGTAADGPAPAGRHAAGGGPVAEGARGGSDGIATDAGPARDSGSGGREAVTPVQGQADGAARAGGPATDAPARTSVASQDAAAAKEATGQPSPGQPGRPGPAARRAPASATAPGGATAPGATAPGATATASTTATPGTPAAPGEAAFGPAGPATAGGTAARTTSDTAAARPGGPAGPGSPAASGEPRSARPTPRHGTTTGSPDSDNPATSGDPTEQAGDRSRVPGTRPGFQDDQEPPGAAPWVRCFTGERRPATPPSPGITDSWHIRASAATAYGKNDRQVFAHDAAADTVLALLGDPAEPGTSADLLGAARDALRTGRLVAIAPGPGLTGLCASLHVENPALGITLIRALPGHGLHAARRFAAATPGLFREVILDEPGAATESGAATEPVMVATEPAEDGTFPLGPADVVLLSGITRAGDLACATSLASRGAALAVIAPPGAEDPRMAALLTRLRSAGVRVSRKKADLADPGQVAAAVRSLERGLGPVTAVVHAAASGPVERCARLSEPTLRAFLSSQRARFGNVIGAVAMERVRVLVTFGSIAARYGRAGGACDALASGLLAEQAARRAEAWPRCRVLHLDWAPWAEPEHAEPAGGPEAGPQPGQAAPIPVAEGSRLLLSLLTTADMPARAAVHGRLGLPAPQGVRPGPAAPAARGRFGEATRAYYPGVELVADTRLSVRADPYLADYRIDDLPMLPAAMVLEAMAQTAAALAGRELRHVTGVQLAAPVLLLGRTGHEEAVIRVCALRAGDTVETVLRCAETGFRLDHARAVFTAARPATAPSPGGWAAGPGRGTGGVAPGAMVDGTDLYGQVFFQTGRFRRVAFLPEASSRACRALVRGGDDLPWFGAVPGPVDAPLVLGSPGLNDATLHVLQACLPHRRLLATGCESVTFSGREVRGALRVQAVRRLPAAGDAPGLWDVVAADATGQPVVTWQGVQLRDVGALAPAGAWHPALLAISMEARAAEFGLDPALRAVISCGAPPREAGRPGGARNEGRWGGGWDTRTGGTGPGGSGQGWADRAEGTGPLAGFELTVQASRPVACRWQAVGEPAAGNALLDEALIGVRDQLAARLREPSAALEARLATIAAALAALGRVPGTPLRAEDACDAGWIVVRARDMAAASAVTRLSGVDTPVAVALASLPARPGTAGPGTAGPGPARHAGPHVDAPLA